MKATATTAKNSNTTENDFNLVSGLCERMRMCRAIFPNRIQSRIAEIETLIVAHQYTQYTQLKERNVVCENNIYCERDMRLKNKSKKSEPDDEKELWR